MNDEEKEGATNDFNARVCRENERELPHGAQLAASGTRARRGRTDTIEQDYVLGDTAHGSDDGKAEEGAETGQERIEQGESEAQTHRRLTACGYVYRYRRSIIPEFQGWRWERADGKPGMTDLVWCDECERAMPRNEYRGHYNGPGACCSNCRDKRPSKTGGRVPIGAKLRFQILHRDNFTCRYCGRKAPDVTLHIDHVIPVSQGGLNHIENLVTACEECNFGKKDLNL